MNTIQELRRLESPAPKPQSLAWDGTHLWMGSRQTSKVHKLDPATWTVDWQVQAPGIPWGMTWVNGELRVLCGEGTGDLRIIRRLVPDEGFDPTFAIPCPDDTGSQLSFDGHQLHVSQWYRKRVLVLGADGTVERTISVPHEICGQTFAAGKLHLLTTDDEETTDYWLTAVDLSGLTPGFEDIAIIPFAARALAFDGEAFWTNHREQNEMVRFALRRLV